MRSIIARFAFLAIFTLQSSIFNSPAHAQLAALVGVDSNNVIRPVGAVASIQQLAEVAGHAVAAAAAADAATAAAVPISNRLSVIEATIASQQAHAIFRGHVLSFSSAVEPVTNVDVQIVKFATRSVATNYYADLYTWFSAAPSNAPTIDFRARFGSGDWSYLPAVSNSWPDTVAVATTGGVYQAYVTTCAVPASYTSAFFRVNGKVALITGDDSVLNLPGGLAINGQPGMTTNIVNGATTNKFLWGVLVP
jgi:hypothetical protein